MILFQLNLGSGGGGGGSAVPTRRTLQLTGNPAAVRVLAITATLQASRKLSV